MSENASVRFGRWWTFCTHDVNWVVALAVCYYQHEGFLINTFQDNTNIMTILPIKVHAMAHSITAQCRSVICSLFMLDCDISTM